MFYIQDCTQRIKYRKTVHKKVLNFPQVYGKALCQRKIKKNIIA